MSILIFQQSFLEQSLDETKVEESKEEKTDELTIPGLEIVIDDDEEESQNNSEEPAEVVSLESDESKIQLEESKEDSQDVPEENEDDDDVILNEIAPIKIVVDDDDDDLKDETSTNESIKIKEEKLDDGFVEVAGLVSLQNGGQIKIKAEPIDPGKYLYLWSYLVKNYEIFSCKNYISFSWFQILQVIKKAGEYLLFLLLFLKAY